MHWSAMILSLSLAAACGSPAEDADRKSSYDDGHIPSCIETSSAITLDEITPLGFSAADVLALATGPRTEVFEWLDDNDVTDLQLEVTQRGSDARYIDSQPNPDAIEDTGGAARCSGWVEADARMTFVTADGGFAEDISTSLTARSVDEASIDQRVDYTQIDGSYSMPEDAIEAAVTWEASFRADGAEGSVEESYSRDLGDGVGSSTHGTIGVWGSSKK